MFAPLHWMWRKPVLALVVTLINNPGDAGFSPAWWLACSRSLPAGVAIGLFMTFCMKPKLDRLREAAAWAAW